MKKVFSVVIAVMIATLTFAACAKKPEQSSSSSSSSKTSASLTFAWWGNQARNDRTKQVIQMYEQANPGVTINPQFMDWGSYWTKLATANAANVTPDIIQMDYGYINQYVSNNLLLPLDSYFKNGTFDTANISKDILSSGVVHNKTYAVSMGSNVYCMVYDPLILQKAGITAPSNNWTWEDFDNIVEQVYKTTGIPADPPAYLDDGGAPWIEYVARENGQSFFSKDGKSLGFDSKTLTSVFNRLLSHTKDGSFVSPDKLASVTTVDQGPLPKGKSWITSMWSSGFVAEETAASRSLVMINLPMEKSDKKMGLYNKPSMFISVAASTKYKDASVKFCNYFENNVDANTVLLGERGVPVNTKVLGAVKTKVNAMTGATFDYVNIVNSKNLVSTIDPAPPSTSGQINTLLKTDLDKVYYQKESPEQAAVELISQGNSLLSSQ